MSHPGRLGGAVAIVTGAAHGIGAAVAACFAREGAAVALVDIDAAGTERTRCEILAACPEADLHAVCTDVTVSGSVDAMVEEVVARWGKVDILVNGAGGFDRMAAITEVSDAEWNRVLALNLGSVFLCARAVARVMVPRGAGRIINIASQAGVMPNPYAKSYVPYGAAKAGVIGFTRLLARELGEHGITVNAISPGTTATARVRKVRDADSLRRMAQQNPLGTLVEPEDTAEAAVYLASGAARRVTGVNLNVNAGSAMA